MSRALIAGMLLANAACAATDQAVDPGLDSTVLVEVESPASRPNALNAVLSPDGTRLAWTEQVEAHSAVFVANTDGSAPIRLTHGMRDVGPIWSPDGRWIAYGSVDPDDDIFVVPSTGGEPRQLTSGSASDRPRAWLRDGSGVVFLRTGAGAIQTLVAPLDGGPARPLLPARDDDQWVTPSPDGSKAAFIFARDGKTTLWVQDIAGGEARELTREGLEQATANMWSPDGRFLAYTSRRTGTSDIWISEVETGRLRQLTTDVNDDRFPVWSPDGRWIAFQSNRGGQYDVWIMPAEGGAARRVTNDIGIESGVQWSPDGRSLYFTVSDGGYDVGVMPVGGGESRKLVDWPGYGSGFADLSPDGQTVLFWSDRGGKWDVWSIPFAGGEPTPFAASSAAELDPKFSPDGRRVVFRSRRAGSFDLWLMPAAGGTARQLMDWPSNEGTPFWSPDGTKIAFISTRGSDPAGLWVIPADGGKATRLATNQFPQTSSTHRRFSWSPDSRSLYYIGFTGSGSRDLFRVPVSGGEPEPLGAHPRIRDGALSPDGSHFAYITDEAGSRYVEVIPTGGGAARRLTTEMEHVEQANVLWSPDGSYLVVGAQVIPENTTDLLVVTWPEGVWRPLTRTPGLSEQVWRFTPDGRQLLVSTGSLSEKIVSVSVADLIAGVANEQAVGR